MELRPEYAEAHNNLGIVLVRDGRVDEAIAHFRKGLAIDPANTQVRKNLETALAGRRPVAASPGVAPSR